MLKNKGVAIAGAGLIMFLAMAVHAQNYIGSLVGNLLEIGYPISREDVVALDKIAMRFDSRNRLDVIKKILSDREVIHGIKGAGYVVKTEAICNTLRLLDEHNLPETDALIEVLSRQGGWEKREKERLSYMAAKRNIDYSSNTAYLLEALVHYSDRTATRSAIEISTDILDFCNVLSYLSDIFSQFGDVKILNALFGFANRAYGYPGEFSSHLMVDMFLHQSKVFISVLAEKGEQTKNTIIDSMVFGIWNNQQKENVLKSIRDNLVLEDDSEKRAIALLRTKLDRKFTTSPGIDNGSPSDKNSEK